MIHQNNETFYTKESVKVVEYFAITLSIFMLALAAFYPVADLKTQFMVGAVAVVAWVFKYKEFALFTSCAVSMLIFAPLLYWLFGVILSLP